jgi:pimeloyl-ACP methyl ester carboxylesterase
MDHYGRRSCNKRVLIAALLACMVTACAGGGYLGFYTRKAHWQTTFENLPSMSALNRLAPEESLVLSGRIVRLQKRQEPLLLAAVSNQYRRNEKVALVQLPASGDAYTTFLPQGDYELLVFADLDENKDFEWNELVGRTAVTVSPDHARGGAVMEGPPITVDFDQPGKVDFHLSETVRPTSYVYASLTDEFFDPKYGATGLYNPSELIAHIQGFFFGLEDYNEKKTMVLFVHGISGTPRDWEYMVSGMDRTRFQPFFFYYPSGLPLDKLGTLLAQFIGSVDKAKNGGCRIVLVAHSMGGLVALSAINKLSEEGLPSALRMYCTFSTPYAGDEIARKGIEMAPVVVPVWRDIAADSEFLRDLTSRPFPKQLPYYLYFSYHDSLKFKLGESSDGSVTLRSQLVPSLQSAAVKVIGFNETHVGILNSPETRESFLRLLDTVTPPRHAHGNGE